MAEYKYNEADFTELKKAHAMGLRIQIDYSDTGWGDINNPRWNTELYKYRIHPDDEHKLFKNTGTRKTLIKLK